MTITINQFKEYMIDVKGYSDNEVNEMIIEMRELGVPIQEYLNYEDLQECVEFSR